MSPAEQLMVELFAGSAVLGLWLFFRTEGPSTLMRACIHVAVALVLGGLMPAAVHNLLHAGWSIWIPVFLVVLPCLTYTCLASMWFIARAQDLLYKRR